MVVALSASNPLYLALILLGVILVAVLAPKGGTAVAGFRALLTFGLVMFVVAVVVATINGNYGDHILFEIPGPEFPRWLGGLRLGGPVSAEGLVASCIRALAILCVLLAFAVFNGAVSPHQVLHTAPAALFHAGLVVTVGLTLLPSSIEDVRRLREMRALRGGATGLRGLPPLVVPAVIGGLERSMRLAEAMEARGYASGPPPAPLPRAIALLSAPLLLVATSLWFYYPDWRPLAAVSAIAAVGCLAFWVRAASSSRQTTRLHQEPLPPADAACVALSLAGIGFALFGPAVGWLDMGYDPFDGLPMPPFELAGALLAVACAWPALRLALAPVPRAAEAAPPGETRTVHP